LNKYGLCFDPVNRIDRPKYTTQHFHKTHTPGIRLRPDHMDESGGYWISSKIKSYQLNIRDNFTRSIILNKGSNFDGSIQALIFPLYESTNSPPDSVQWVIKYQVDENFINAPNIPDVGRDLGINTRPSSSPSIGRV
jgi:hypothetical protein